MPRRPAGSAVVYMPSNTHWIAAAALLALLLLALLGFSIRRRRALKRRLPDDWALQPRAVFNLDERRFYRQICAALPGCVVLAKLPLVRLCQPLRPREVRYWYDLLGAIHVTFAICTPMGRVLAVVDIEGDRASSRRTQQIKESVLAACEVRYLRCPPEQMPSVPELRALVPLPVPAVPANSPVAETSERLASTVKSRRLARGNAWQDSVAAPIERDFVTSSLTGGNNGFGAIVLDDGDPPVRH